MRLLDGDALGEIPRLIDVASPADRDVIREQLQRNREQNRRHQGIGIRHREHDIRRGRGCRRRRRAFDAFVTMMTEPPRALAS